MNHDRKAKTLIKGRLTCSDEGMSINCDSLLNQNRKHGKSSGFSFISATF